MLAATKRAISFVVGEAAREENFGECGEIKSAGVPSATLRAGSSTPFVPRFARDKFRSG